MAELLNCPCCGEKASVTFSRTASLGLQGWKADCTKCIESEYFVRFDRERVIADWNKYASEVASS